MSVDDEWDDPRIKDMLLMERFILRREARKEGIHEKATALLRRATSFPEGLLRVDHIFFEHDRMCISGNNELREERRRTGRPIILILLGSDP